MRASIDIECTTWAHSVTISVKVQEGRLVIVRATDGQGTDLTAQCKVTQYPDTRVILVQPSNATEDLTQQLARGFETFVPSLTLRCLDEGWNPWPAMNPPKNWRWFHIYRHRPVEVPLKPPRVQGMSLRRTQERQPRKAAYQQKRRQYLHRLYHN
jgi:hypothetical protein